MSETSEKLNDVKTYPSYDVRYTMIAKGPDI